MSKILVICARRYNGHELWTALGVMADHGLEFEVTSTQHFIEDELTARPNTVERTVFDINPQELTDQFDGLMIVSGNMGDTEAYWTMPQVLSLVETANKDDLPIAAICCSVPTIRFAATRKKVSFYPLVRSRILLTEAGAIPNNVACTVDDKLVTAEHQMATQLWANAFSRVIKGEPHGVNLQQTGFMPRGRERKPIQALEKLKRSPNKDWYALPQVNLEALIQVAKETDTVHFHKQKEVCNDNCFVVGGDNNATIPNPSEQGDG